MTATPRPDPQQPLVSEVFGPTFQGEGAALGQQAMFVRLATCNLDCRWCDTPYTWDWSRFVRDEQVTARSVDEVLGHLTAHDPLLVVITGGEPLIQHRSLLRLATALRSQGRRIHVETNGTIAAPPELVDAVDLFTVSPKLSGSGVPAGKRIRPSVLRTFTAGGKAVFKFVISDPATEVTELMELQREYGLDPVWVMPEGVDADAVLNGLRALAEPALRYGWHLTPRLHVLLWGDERGR